VSGSFACSIIILIWGGEEDLSLALRQAACPLKSNGTAITPVKYPAGNAASLAPVAEVADNKVVLVKDLAGRAEAAILFHLRDI